MGEAECRKLALRGSTPQKGLRNNMIQSTQIGYGYFVLHDVMIEPSRFIALFSMTVRQLPPKCTSSLELYWQSRSPPHFPKLVLESTTAIVSDDGLRYGVAVCEDAGRQLRFSAPAIESIDDRTGCTLFAHELAHVFSFAEMENQSDDVEALRLIIQSPASPEHLREILETHADRLLKSWGFDPLALRRWTSDYLDAQQAQLQPTPMSR
jgi:hypothetical protein